MKSLTKKLSGCVLPRDQLLPLLEPYLPKKNKNKGLPWVFVVKRLLTIASDRNSKVLFENACSIIKIHLDETVKKGLKNPGQLSQRYSDALSSLLTHLHFIVEDTNFQVTEMHRLSSLILAAVIDTSITAYQKGEEESLVVAKIFMKLTLIFGHSQEQLLDAVLHCRTLIHPGSRQPSIQVPLIKRLFSSVRNGQAMSPLLYLKYLLLGKLWLFMTEKTELGKTRMYITKMLRLPKCVPEWAEREEVPWLSPLRWNTRLVMKSMTLTGALKTFYGNRDDGSVYSGQLDKRKNKLSTAPSQKTKCEPSKSSVKRSEEGRVKTKNACSGGKTETSEGEECLRASVSELERDEDMKQELQIVDLSNHVAEEAVLSCSKRSKKGARGQPTRKSIEADQKAKKRKTRNDMEETETRVKVTIKRKKIKHRTEPEVPDHIEEGETSVEVTSKRKKIKHKTKPEVPDKEGNKAVKRLNKGILDKANARHVYSGESSGASAIAPEPEDLQENVNSIHETEIEQAEPVDHSIKLKYRKRLRMTGLLEGVSSSHKTVEQPWKLKSRKRLGSEELAEDTSSILKTEQQPKALELSCKLKPTKRLRNPSVDRDSFNGNFTRLGQFSSVSEVSADAIPQGTSGQEERKARSRKHKHSKKLQRIRRNCMTFMVTDLEAGKASIVQEESEEDCGGDKEDPSGGENSDLEAVNTLQTESMSSVTGKGSTDMLGGVGSRLNQKLSRESNPLHNITAHKPDTCSEDSSDYDRSDGETETLSETLACDGKQEESTGWLFGCEEQDAASSENPEESDEERIQETENTTVHMSEKESNVFHNEEFKLFVLGSDTDSGRGEEPKVELVNTGKGVTVDGEKEHNGTVTLEDGSDVSEVKEECASTPDASDKRGSIGEISCENLSSTSGNMFNGSHKGGSESDNASSKVGDSEGEIVVTEYKITKLDKEGEGINMNTIIKEIVDLSTSDQEEKGEGCKRAAGEVKVIQNHYRHQNAANLKDTRISNGSQASAAPDSDIEIVMEEVTLKTEHAVCSSGSDVLEVFGSENDINSYEKLKPEAVQREVKRILKEEEEELKLKRETKQASPISELDADITNTLLPHKSSKRKDKASQDPVSKMINNLYKTKVASNDGEEKVSNKQTENLKVLNTQHLDEAAEATEKVMVRHSVPLEDSASHLKEPDTPGLDNDDDDNSKSVELIDVEEDIECVLQNIFKDTRRATSIGGLREKLLTKSSIKEETNDDKKGEETKGAVRASEILPCSSQAKTADSPSSHLSESFASTADVCVKPEDPVDKKGTGSLLSVKDERIESMEDTETLLRSIMSDEGRMAGIRELRERLLGNTPRKERGTRSADYEVKTNSKEALKDSITFLWNSQDTLAENSKSLLREGIVGAEAIQINIKASPDKKLTSSVNRKDDSGDEMHCVEENSESSGTLCTENNGEAADTDGRSNNTSTREEEQQFSDSKNCSYEEYNKYQSDEPVCCTSGTGSRGNNLSSADGREEETSPKTLDAETVEENRTEEPPDASQSTDDNSLPGVDVDNTEMESIMDEPLEKSIESINGADEAYEASSDASEDPAPRTRRRSRSLRKSCAHQDLQQASDSDSSPVRAARWKISVLDITSHQRPKRKRSQSCSLDTLSLELKPCNMTPFLQNSGNKTYTIEKEYLGNTTFTIEARRSSYSETSATPKDTSCFFEEKELVACSESKQDESSTESVLDVSVEGNRPKLSEGEPQPHKNGSDLSSINLRRASEEGTPLPTVSIVLNETSKSDPPESSFNTSSESLLNRDMLSILTSVEKDLSPSSGSSTELFVETSSPFKLNSNYAGQAEESVGLSKDAVPTKAVEGTTPKPCLSHTEERTSNEPAVLPREYSHQSKNSEVVKEQNPSLLSENAAQKSMGEIKKIANGESHPEAHQMKDCDAHEKAGTAQDPKNEIKHEEISKDTDGSEKVVGIEINQEMVAEIYEGEEVEVLSTSGIEEEDEGETVSVSPEALGDDNGSGPGAEKVDLLISKKSLRSHICQQHLPKDGKEMNADTGSKESKAVPIPGVKVHCLSEVALTKEVLISPDVSDEECELVSPGVDLNGVKLPIEEDGMEDAIHDNNTTSVCIPSCSLQKGSGGINSPHKTIPEEQDESTVPGNTTESIPKSPSVRKGKSTVTPPSLSTQTPEKLAERGKCTRRSSRGVTSEGSPSSPQSSDTPKSTKCHTKSSKAQSIIQEEPAAVMSDPEGMSDTSSKSSTEIKRHERRETVASTHDNSESLMCKNDSLSTAAKGSRAKGQLNSPNSANSPRKDWNGRRSASHERMLPSSQNQNSEPSHKDPERCERTESQTAKRNAADASGEECEEDGETKRNGPSSHCEEEASSCDAPHQLAIKTRRRRSSSSSSSTPVRRSSRLMKQPSPLSSLTNDTRNPGSSAVLVESERETEEAEERSGPGCPMSLRKNKRTAPTTWKVASETN